MLDRKRLIASAAIAAVLTLGAGTAVIAQQGNLSSGENDGGEGKDSEASLTGASARQAADAALRATGGGTVQEVEKSDDPGAAYEVEVRKAEGSVVEVSLDGDFGVTGQEADD